MDRIDKLLQKLGMTEQQIGANYYARGESGDDPDCRDAIRQQIADEWRAKDAALEAAVEKLTPPGCTCGAHETVVPLLKAALARGKGEGESDGQD